MSILKRGRSGAAPKRPQPLRGRKRKPSKQVGPAQTPEDEVATATRLLTAGDGAEMPETAAPRAQNAAAAADGLRSAIAEVGSQLDEALRRVTDLKTQATEGERAGTAIEAAAADFDRAVEKIEQALAAIDGAAAREAAGAMRAFHRDFKVALSDIVDQQHADGAGKRTDAASVSWWSASRQPRVSRL